MASRMMILKKKQAIGLEEEGEAEEEFKIMQSYCGLSTPLSSLMEGPTPQRFENVGVMRRGQGWGWLRLGQLSIYIHSMDPIIHYNIYSVDSIINYNHHLVCMFNGLPSCILN